MRILHLTRDFPPHSTGGTSTAVGSLVAAQRQHGIASAVVSFDHWRGARAASPRIAPANDPTVRLRIRSGAPFAAIAAVASDFAPTHIHLHHENLWPFAAHLRDLSSRPIAYTCHVLQPAGRLTASSRDQAAAIAACDAVLAPSRATAAEIASRHGRPATVVANIVDCPAVRPAPERRQRRVVYAGRFDHAKGTDILFEVMRIAVERDRTVTFDVAGGLPASRKHDARWRRRWQQASDPATAERVKLHGWLSHDHLSALYATCAVALVPSRNETFGLSAAEAMAHSVPVLAASIASLEELISDGSTGYLSDLDPVAITARLFEILDDDRASRVGRAAADSIRTRFAAGQVIRSLRTAYDRVA